MLEYNALEGFYMPKNNNITYLSEQNEKCLMEIFTKIFNETSDFSYTEAVTDIALYLIGSENKYDDILSKYEGVDKQNLLQIIFSYFLVMNKYRQKNNIVLDERRKNILNLLENAKGRNVGISLLQFDIYDVVWALTDSLIYINHPSPIFSSNAIKSMREEGYFEKLYQVYPFEIDEQQFIELINKNFNSKEILLYTLIEKMVIEVERLIFSWGNFPIYDLGYLMLIENTLKEYNGRNKLLPNIHCEILKSFNDEIKISQGNNYNKILLLEILLSTVQTKHRCCIPESKEEKQIVEMIHKTNLSLEILSDLYDNNEGEIISSLINDWNMFPIETMLLDIKWFEEVKEQGVKTLKKDLKKDDFKN